MPPPIRFVDLLRFSVKASSCARWFSVFISLFFSDRFFGVEFRALAYPNLVMEDCECMVPSMAFIYFFWNVMPRFAVYISYLPLVYPNAPAAFCSPNTSSFLFFLALKDCCELLFSLLSPLASAAASPPGPPAAVFAKVEFINLFCKYLLDGWLPLELRRLAS